MPETASGNIIDGANGGGTARIDGISIAICKSLAIPVDLDFQPADAPTEASVRSGVLRVALPSSGYSFTTLAFTLVARKALAKHGKSKRIACKCPSWLLRYVC